MVALIALPSDFGLRAGAFVVTPQRALLAFAGLAASVEAWRERSDSPVVPGRAIVLAWIAFGAAATISAAIGGTGSGLARLGSLAVEGAGVFWVTWRVSRRAAVLVQAVAVGTTTVVCALTTGLMLIGSRYEWLLGARSIGMDIRYGIERQQASFDAPLFYAVWLVAAGALALGLFRRGGGSSFVVPAAWTILAVGVMTTASRFGIIAVPAILAAFLAATNRWRSAVLPLSATGAILLVFLVSPGGITGDSGPESNAPVATALASPAAPTETDAVTPGATPAVGPAATPRPTDDLSAERLRGSTSARVDAARAAVAAVQARPLFGWGLLSAKQVAAQILGHVNYVDNTYLVDIIEMGVIGTGAFLALLLLVLLRCWPPTSELSTSQVLGLLSLLAFGLVVANLATAQGYALFWLVSGLAVATADVERGSRRLS